MTTIQLVGYLLSPLMRTMRSYIKTSDDQFIYNVVIYSQANKEIPTYAFPQALVKLFELIADILM